MARKDHEMTKEEFSRAIERKVASITRKNFKKMLNGTAKKPTSSRKSKQADADATTAIVCVLAVAAVAGAVSNLFGKTEKK